MRFRDIYGKRDPRGGRPWRRLRDVMIRREPICRQCGKQVTTDVHHIEPVVRRPDLALVQSNLLPCCSECHHLLDHGMLKPKIDPPPRADGDYAC